MPIRRVTIPSNDVLDQQLQDAISRLTRSIDDKVLRKYGDPRKIVYSDVRAKFGEFLRCDPTNESITIYLPQGNLRNIGQSIAIANIGASTNTITIDPINGLVNGESSLSINTGYAIREATYVGPNANNEDLWILTTILNGSTIYAGGVIPLWKWNGTDLTQFKAKRDGTSVNSSTWSVVSSGGHNWIRGNVTTTGAATVSMASSLLPINYALPTSNYSIRADMIVVSLGFGQATGGVLVRGATSTGMGTGYAHLFFNSSHDLQLYRFDASEAQAIFHTFLNPETMAANKGMEWHLDVTGSTVLRTRLDHRFQYLETAGTYPNAGDCGLLAGINRSGTNSAIVQYRNVRIFSVPHESE